MPFCYRCGASYDAASRFCKICGAPIAGVTVLPSQPMVPAIPIAPVVYVVQRKSVGVAILLTFLFGPLGMLYSTVSGALIMIAVSFILALVTAGISLFITWPICIVWGALAAESWNAGRR